MKAKLKEELIVKRNELKKQIKAIDHLLNIYEPLIEKPEVNPVFKKGDLIKLKTKPYHMKNFTVGKVYQIKRFMSNPKRHTFGKYSLKNDNGVNAYLKEDVILDHFKLEENI